MQAIGDYMKVRKFLSSWKEVILISVFCMTLFIFAERDHENPFYPNQLRTGPEVMADRWPRPDFNDPNFLSDFRKYIGFDFHSSEDVGYEADEPNRYRLRPIWHPLWPLKELDPQNK